MVVRINMGCGNRLLDGWLNVDKYPPESFEDNSPEFYLFDFEAHVWHWQDSSIDELRAEHSLEHMGQETTIFLRIMTEAWRVLKPGGKFTIIFPDPRSDGYLGDPTHCRPLTPQIFTLFSKKINEENLSKGWPNTPLALQLGIDFEPISVKGHLSPGIPEDQVEARARFNNNVIDEWTVELIAVKEG